MTKKQKQEEEEEEEEILLEDGKFVLRNAPNKLGPVLRVLTVLPC